MNFDWKNNKQLWVIAGLGVALLIVIIVFIVQSVGHSREIEQLRVENERIVLEQEYAELADQYAQYESQKMVLKNDSLIERLEAEQIKVQRLYEELRSEKATSAARIAELRGELETLRGIMRGYIAQIDSLNRENAGLRRENAAVRAQYADASARASELEAERDSLTEKVTIASKLDAVNVTVKPLRKNGKVAKKIKQIAQLEISFSIAKNVTAATGEVQVYARIRKPDGDIMVKNDSDVFAFEGSQIPYSCVRTIEYAGEEINSVTMYWNVDEYLYPGAYEVEIFVQNYVIGRGAFSLE